MIFVSVIISNPSRALSKVAAPISVAWEAPPRTIDPRFNVDADSQYLEDLIHCSIASFDKNGQTVGDLAEGWAWSDPTTLVVRLKPNAKFSDGTAVTAADVAATYSFFKKTDLKTPSPRAGAFSAVASVTADKGKVVFKLNQPDATFVTNLVIGVLPEKIANGDIVSEHPKMVGCGPFKISSVTVNHFELVRNEHYGLGHPAKSERIEIKIVRDETTRFAKLRKGEVDIVQNILSRDVLETLAKTSPNLRIERRPGLNTTYLGFNMKDPVLANPKVRQAISQAINREAIIKYALKGLAQPASTMLPPSDPFFNKSVPSPTYDPTAAQKILDDAGLVRGPGGKPRFSLSYKTTNNMTRVAIAKAIAADLRKIGIDVVVEPLEWGRFKADVEAGRVQMWSLSWVGFKDPDIYRYAFATENFPPTGGNRGWYSNPELDKLLGEARAVTDNAKRRELYNKVQDIVAKELPYVFLWHEEIFAVVNKGVKDFEIYADGRFASLRQTVRNP
jgi:peptide/nickel transport system substrate-binding protein